MNLTDFLGALVAHNTTGKGYQIQLNSGNLGKTSNRNTDVEFGDLFFAECSTLKNEELLCFGNSNRKPIGRLEDGTNLYPSEINSQMFLDLRKIENIEELKDFRDWFQFPSERVINIYMFPQNKYDVGCQNVITVGFMS